MAKATKLSSFFLCCINSNVYGFERTSRGEVGPFHLSKERSKRKIFMHSLAGAELFEDEEEEFVRFTDQVKNSISLPLSNFVPKYEEKELGRKLSSLALTETSENLVRLLDELCQKKELFHKLQNEVIESSSFWIRNYSSVALQVSTSVSGPVHVKRKIIQSNVSSKKSKGISRSEELSNQWSLEKNAELAWSGFIYLEMDDIDVESFDVENTARLVHEVSLQMDPGKLVISVAAYGPPVDDVRRITQQNVGQFQFKALSSKDVLSAAKQIIASGGQLKYFPGGKVLASVYRLDQERERNVEQYIAAKEQFVTGGNLKKITNQDWVKLCLEGKEMFEETSEGETHMRRLLRSFDLWSKHQIDTVINLVSNCDESPLLFKVLNMISNFEVKGLTPSESQTRKKMSHNLSFEHLRLMSQTEKDFLKKLLLLVKNQEIDLVQFKEEMRRSITIDKLKSISCHILKSDCFRELEIRFGAKIEDSVLMNYSRAVLSVKGAPNWHYRELETYLNQLDNNVIPHKISPQYESFSTDSEFSQSLKTGLIDNSSLVIINMGEDSDVHLENMFSVVEVLSCQHSFSCFVIGSTKDICLLHVHLTKIYEDFKPVLLSFERKSVSSQVWNEDRQHGLFLSNSWENHSVETSFSTHFSSSFEKALTLLTERFLMPGQKLTFIGLPGIPISVPKNISSLSQRGNRILFFGSKICITAVRRKVGQIIIEEAEDVDVDDNEEDSDEHEPSTNPAVHLRKQVPTKTFEHSGPGEKNNISMEPEVTLVVNETPDDSFSDESESLLYKGASSMTK